MQEITLCFHCCVTVFALALTLKYYNRLLVSPYVACHFLCWCPGILLSTIHFLMYHLVVFMFDSFHLLLGLAEFYGS